MKGINHNILRVDLTTRKTTIEDVPEEHYRRYLGGRGFIATTLLQELSQGIISWAVVVIVLAASPPFLVPTVNLRLVASGERN